MKSAGNEGVVQSCLQVLHVHVFLAAPLGYPPRGEVGCRPASGRSCRQGMSPPRRCGGGSPGSATQSHCWCGCASNDRWEVTVGQRFLNAVLDLLGGLLQLHGTQFSNHGLRLLAGRLFALLGVDRLEHFCHNFDLGFGHNGENVAVEMHRAALVSIMR